MRKVSKHNTKESHYGPDHESGEAAAAAEIQEGDGLAAQGWGVSSGQCSQMKTRH